MMTDTGIKTKEEEKEDDDFTYCLYGGRILGYGTDNIQK